MTQIISALSRTARLPVLKLPFPRPILPLPAKPVPVTPASLISVPGIGAVVPASRTTRPLWFDGRFLAAADIQREQQVFLDRQEALGKAGGFGVIHGLLVDRGPADRPASGQTIVIHAGNGITPSGDLVMLPADFTIQLSDLPEEENLNQQFGLSSTPQQPARTRTGLYVIALRPVEFTANPVTTYPASLAAPRVTRDGDVVEATAVALVPYPNPVNSLDSSIVQAALARQIFLTPGAGTLADSLLPLAIVSVDRGVVQWIDPYLVRRDSGPPGDTAVLGSYDVVAQQAFLLQYDARLQAAVAEQSRNPAFAATSYFQALPAAGRFPLASIDPVHFTQAYFPEQMDVTLALIPSDELPSVLEDSMSLPPIDLTLPAASYANISVYTLVPVNRDDFDDLSNSLPATRLTASLPAPVLNRPLLQLLRLQPVVAGNSESSAGWAAAMKGLDYGYYVRRRSQPVVPDFTLPPAPTTTPAPATTPGA
jgi:hypothetical protein